MYLEKPPDDFHIVFIPVARIDYYRIVPLQAILYLPVNLPVNQYFINCPGLEEGVYLTDIPPVGKYNIAVLNHAIRAY